MIRWLLVTDTDWHSASADMCLHGVYEQLVREGYTAHKGWDDPLKYDVAIVMGYDLALFEKLKAHNPNIIVGVGDPKRTKSAKAIRLSREADFVFLSSVEQRDNFLDLNPRSFVYYMFPDVEPRAPVARSNKISIIGYHGNRVHLDAFRCMVENELVDAAHETPFKLRLVYNFKTLGRVQFKKLSKVIEIEHVQWSQQGMMDALNECDIGVVPNYLPILGESVAKRLFRYPTRRYVYESGDYLHRYKLSTNPGRIYPFAMANVPVIADATPSASQFVLDGITGKIVCNARGWRAAVCEMLKSRELRELYAANMRTHIDQWFSRKKTFTSFLKFVEDIRKKKAADRQR